MAFARRFLQAAQFCTVSPGTAVRLLSIQEWQEIDAFVRTGQAQNWSLG